MVRYICPICRREKEMPQEGYYECEECRKKGYLSPEMRKKAVELSKALAGKTILAVAYEDEGEASATEVRADGGTVYIILSDGWIEAWNSEWGGIRYRKRKELPKL
jgi:hypothetical protein